MTKNALFWLLFLGVTIFCVVPPALTRCAFCCPGPRHRCVVATSEDAHRHTRAQTHTIARTTRTSHHPRLPRRTHTLAHTRLPCRFPTRQQLSLATHTHDGSHELRRITFAWEPTSQGSVHRHRCYWNRHRHAEQNRAGDNDAHTPSHQTLPFDLPAQISESVLASVHVCVEL